MKLKKTNIQADEKQNISNDVQQSLNQLNKQKSNNKINKQKLEKTKKQSLTKEANKQKLEKAQKRKLNKEAYNQKLKKEKEQKSNKKLMKLALKLKSNWLLKFEFLFILFLLAASIYFMKLVGDEIYQVISKGTTGENNVHLNLALIVNKNHEQYIYAKFLKDPFFLIKCGILNSLSMMTDVFYATLKTEINEISIFIGNQPQLTRLLRMYQLLISLIFIVVPFLFILFFVHILKTLYRKIAIISDILLANNIRQVSQNELNAEKKVEIVKKPEKTGPKNVKVKNIKSEKIKIEKVRPVKIKLEKDKLEVIKPKTVKLEKVKVEKVKIEKVKPEKVKIKKIKVEKVKTEKVKPEKVKIEMVKPEKVKPKKEKPVKEEKIKKSVNKISKNLLQNFTNQEIETKELNKELFNAIPSKESLKNKKNNDTINSDKKKEKTDYNIGDRIFIDNVAYDIVGFQNRKLNGKLAKYVLARDTKTGEIINFPYNQ